tara:strand:+ start:57 stop:602 length:546 start_codon:yes stop_codon:yes gene_type:complete
MKKNKALFLDRDGIINLDHGYVHNKESFEFIPEIFEVCRAAIEKEYIIVVVTNQSGIGRGYFNEEQFHKLTEWMKQCFMNEGIYIQKVYYCPFHTESKVLKYKKNSKFRKPNPGMILQARDDLTIDLEKSILVGDKLTDIKAGINAGIKKNFLYKKNKIENKPYERDFKVLANLKDIVEYY